MSTDPHGLAITELSTETARQLVDLATGTPSGDLPETVAHLDYAFAAYLHGYDIAVRDESGWTWASSVLAGSGPGVPRNGPPDGLERLRFYGGTGEIVIARQGSGWRAWQLVPTAADRTGPVRPRPRSFLVATASTVRARFGPFTRLTHDSGQVTVVPAVFTGPLGYAEATEYFTTDPATGAVRVAAVVWTGYSDQPTAAEES